MRIAASILTWLGWVVYVVVTILRLLYGINSQGQIYPIQTNGWAWAFAMIGLGFSLFIAILRETQVRAYKFKLLGILTIIFVSIPGGILTLLIPVVERTAYDE